MSRITDGQTKLACWPILVGHSTNSEDVWRAAKRLEAWLDEGCDVYAYFNNDYHGYAVDDARWLAERLRQ